MNSDHLLPSKESQNVREKGKGFAVSLGFDFRERVCNFSLRSRSIGNSQMNSNYRKTSLEKKMFLIMY